MTFAHALIENARIQFADGPRPDDVGVAFRGGFVPADDGSQRALRQCRDGNPVDAFEETVSYPLELQGTFSYGGLIYHHFGHVMSEMVHRIMTVRSRFIERPWLFVGLPGPETLRPFATLPTTFQNALRFLDVAPQDVLCVHANACVERLQIAEQGSDFGGGPKPGYLDILGAHARAKLPALAHRRRRSRRLYVSRSRLAPGAHPLGEAWFEERLRDEGFEIYHPQEHAFEAQLSTYAEAEVAIFPEGSACHGLELLGANVVGTCVYLERRISHRRVFENVLRPRADRLVTVPATLELGTAWYAPDGAPPREIALQAYDFGEVLRALRENAIAHLPDVTEDDYRRACEAELATLALSRTAGEEGRPPDGPFSFAHFAVARAPDATSGAHA